MCRTDVLWGIAVKYSQCYGVKILASWSILRLLEPKWKKPFFEPEPLKYLGPKTEIGTLISNDMKTDT